MSIDVVGTSGFGWYLKPEHVAKLQLEYETTKLQRDGDIEKFNTWLSEIGDLRPWKILIFGNSFTENYGYAVIINTKLVLSTIKGNEENILDSVIPSLKTFFNCDFNIENLQFINETMIW